MKPEKLFLELEELTERLGYKVRKERGNFKGGYCVVEGDRIVMINKNHPPDVQAALLARFLKDKEHDQLYIKPAVRKELEQRWNLQARTHERTNPLFSTGEES